MILILTGHSGVGKTTLANILKQDGYDLLVSYTTRQKREGEVDGKDYFFISTSDFQEKIRSNFFLEYIHVFDNYYGASLKFFEASLNEGRNSIACLTAEGYLASKKLWRDRVVGIYLLPPSLIELKRRMNERGTDCVHKRVNSIERDVCDAKDAKLYDYHLEPSDIDTMRSKVLKIMESCAGILHV